MFILIKQYNSVDMLVNINEIVTAEEFINISSKKEWTQISLKNEITFKTELTPKQIYELIQQEAKK